MVWPSSTNAITVTWMRGRVDLTSWNVLLFLSPLFLSIYLPSTFIRCPSVPGSPSNPTAVPRPFCFLLTTVSFSTFAFPSPLLPLLRFYYFFISSVCSCLSLIPVLGSASRSPCCYERGEWRWPLNSGERLWPLSFLSTLSSSLIYPHSLIFFLFEHQFQQGSATGRTLKVLEWTGEHKKESDERGIE